MPRRSILLFAAACVVIATALAIVTFVVVGRAPGMTSGAAGVAAGEATVTTTGEARIGGPFQLVDQNGRAVDQTLLDGKWSLVFFGFTYCPDYCPTTLAALDATQRAMDPDGGDMQVVFITVDPGRDTPAVLKTYLTSDGFPDGVVGLTGSAAQIQTVADAYGASYEKVGEGDAYTMNHSLRVYLMGPDGNYRGFVTHDLGPARSAVMIRQIMARG
ncbi:SCO family protein [Brevundimonas sp.]|uniref:SCO family protein n=1 Tax=Brevundimonas sp. TaxID=1871086 RepID=UPI0035672462